MATVIMHDYRKSVDNRYVGFRPETSQIKPVHIATGVFRAVLGKTFTADGIKKLSYVMNAKGKTPKGNDSISVFAYLSENSLIETDIVEGQVESFRIMLQKLVNVDKGVYGIDDHMLSYTAGSSSFITSTGMHEDAGEFIGGLIKRYCPILGEYIYNALIRPDDAISLVFEPVLDIGEERTFPDIFPPIISKENPPEYPEELYALFDNPSDALAAYLESIKLSGECLKRQLENHPNKLTQLRLFVLFCSFQLVRYMSLLESFYCGGGIRPILLDFTKEKGSVSQTSGLCYAQLHKSISRFYAWAFAQELRRTGFDKNTLLSSDAPRYDKPNPKKKDNPRTQEELKVIWDIAKDDANRLSDAEVGLVFGAAIYDMIAMEAESHPVLYLRKLGTEVGLLYPPTNMHPDKRFTLGEDMLETILRCCVEPDETIPASELRNRMYDRLGIVVGGAEEDSARLKSIGSIVYTDTDALTSNFELFADGLQRMNFAEQLPDGIMQIRFGGNK